jgi:hypothetical protein
MVAPYVVSGMLVHLQRQGMVRIADDKLRARLSVIGLSNAMIHVTTARLRALLSTLWWR